MSVFSNESVSIRIVRRSVSSPTIATLPPSNFRKRSATTLFPYTTLFRSEQTVTYSLDKGYTVIIEGILSKPKYRNSLIKLMESTSCKSSVFYIDVSIEETIERHKTKPIATEVTAEQLRSWYQPKNYLDVPGEVIIDETSTLEETIGLILKSL